MAGAATTAEHYGGLRADLEAKGFPTVCGNPPSIEAEDATAVTVDTDVAFARDTMLAPLLDEGKDIILLCHSYGGTYGAGAVQGLSKKERASKGQKGGVIGIIYAASFCTEPGESALQTLGIAEIPSWIGPGDKPGTLMFTDASQLWPGLPIEEAKAWFAKMKPCAASAIGTPVSYAPFRDPNYDGIIAFVALEDDPIVTPELVQSYLQKSGIKLTRSIKGPHGIDLQVRDEVIKVVLELAELFKP
ncbi:hypothetical protein BDV95DRAFT_600382 [Massariosphaeria phaeospora]|uniref:AB hydrolase-1 domain-containing protein n=1 Tax=Massariosphaeria phaeospora TaxID=100035 RepID=A0A7C8MAM3_9PLEO|nr:hypothetical protein BDV95DRAFT_600382 [Massariosphaeria phaeospora]